MAFLLVKFTEPRRVLIDGVGTGIDTNRIIEVEAGHHRVSLAGPQDFTPPVQEIVLKKNLALEPEEVHFEKA